LHSLCFSDQPLSLGRHPQFLLALDFRSTSSQSSALCTLRAAGCSETISFPIEQQQRVTAGGLKMRVKDSWLDCAPIAEWNGENFII
jgi:hypothetical protein